MIIFINFLFQINIWDAYEKISISIDFTIVNGMFKK